MSPPWMPFYVGDYLRDTRRLSTLEHGAYVLLIMEYWLNGELPTDDRALAKVTRLTPRQWRGVKIVLDPFLSRAKEYCCHSGYRYVIADIRRRVMQESGGLCAYCGEECDRLELDHVLPIARGGGNEYENLAASCRRCNASKKDRLLEEWIGAADAS